MKHAVKHIHFVGIGGAGMSGIAEILHNLGYRVSGSDAAGSAVTQRLADLGVRVFTGHAASQIEGAQAVVTSTAVKSDNPEVLAARARKVPVVARAVLLAELMRLKQGIAIAGTHGKTTTTSLVASVLAEAGVDPTFVIGGKLESAGTNSRLGAGDYIVVEADESDASFLHLSPVMSVVTNIDADHMDTYGHDLTRLRGAFVEFLHRLPFYGAAVLCTDDPGVRSILPMISRPVIAYGLGEDAQVRALNVQAVAGGQMRFTCRRIAPAGAPALADLEVTLNLAGVHNVRNALAAIAVAQALELPDEAVLRALAGFRGVGRRFQRWGEWPVAAAHGSGTFTLIDDYGHHHGVVAVIVDEGEGATTPWRWLPSSPLLGGPFPAGGWCWPSSPTATPARGIASRTSFRSWARPMRCCCPRCTPRVRRPSWRPTAVPWRAPCVWLAGWTRCSWTTSPTCRPRSPTLRAQAT